jgi:hypothetical protein
MDPAHVRLDRINAGAPLLDSHSAYSVSDMLGTVVPGSVTLTKKAMLGSVRFSKRAAVEEIWGDVKDGIIRDVSVGYRVYQYAEAEPAKPGKLPVRTAIDWEPFEVSMVPIPADAGAKVRGEQPSDANPCEIVTRAAAEGAQPAEQPQPQMPALPAEEKSEMTETRSQTIVQPDPVAPTARAADPATEPNERDLGARQERERVEGIRQACEAGRMTRGFEAKLITDGVPLLEAQRRVFDELRKRDVDVPRSSDRSSPEVRMVGEDPLVHVREGIENAVLHRLHPQTETRETNGQVRQSGFALSEVGRQYRGMSMLRIAEVYLQARGVRTTGLGKMDIASLALGLDVRGMHTTSDFPLLLADVTGKLLRQAYLEAPQTFGPISRQVTLPDFKEAKRLQLGEAPALEEVLEHGEYRSGTIGEGQEKFQLKSYGKKFAITRRALINDDQDAFSRVPMLFGRAARNLESDLVWAQITANGAMADGVALFHADHSNLAGAGAAISIDAIGAGRASMRKQKGLDGATLLNIYPQFLLVPAAKETIADQFVSTNLQANAAGSVNPFAGRLGVIAEPRLDVASTTAWYLAAAPGQIDIIEYAYLEGETGPRITTEIRIDIDGMLVVCGHDFAAKVIDHRGLYMNPGA